MKNLKILGLLVTAAAALMGFASSASAAPVLTAPAGVEYTGEVHMTLASGTSLVIQGGIEDTCTESTIKATITVNTSTHAAGPISVLTDDKCTKHTTTITPGELTIADNGDVFDIGTKFQVVDTELKITCYYGGGASPGTKLGTLSAGSPAKLAVNAKLKRLEGSSFFCAAEATTTGAYTFTTPSSAFIT